MNKEERKMKKNKLYDQIIASSVRFMAVAFSGVGADEDLIRQLRDDTDAAIREVLGLLVLEKKWSFSVPEKPVLKDFKLMAGTNHSYFAENQKDLLRGCLNRLFVTDDSKEFKRLVPFAYYYVDALMHLALEKIGVITIPEYEPEPVLFNL